VVERVLGLVAEVCVFEDVGGVSVLYARKSG